MYEVVYYIYSQKRYKQFETFREAMNFWGSLPFQSFHELYKL